MVPDDLYYLSNPQNLKRMLTKNTSFFPQKNGFAPTSLVLGCLGFLDGKIHVEFAAACLIAFFLQHSSTKR